MDGLVIGQVVLVKSPFCGQWVEAEFLGCLGQRAGVREIGSGAIYTVALENVHELEAEE